jgi:anti-anti-sigma regulatory factor
MSVASMTPHDTLLRLSVDDPIASSLLDATVEAMLSHGAERPRLTIALEGSHLSSTMIVLLVRNLRRLREVGGSITIEPATPALRDAFALHGLQWVFAIGATLI